MREARLSESAGDFGADPRSRPAEPRNVTDAATQQPDPTPPVAQWLRPVDDRAPPSNRLRQALQQECEVMVHRALDQGREIPPGMSQRIAQAVLMVPRSPEDSVAQLAELTNLHVVLSALIAPARARTLVLMQNEKAAHPLLYVFGPVRLVRQMLAFAVVALGITCVLSTIHNVDVPNVAKGWFALGGIDAMCVLGFLISVAALGAAFSNLATINRYIEQGNFDPTYEGSYWVRIVLGLISGVVLAEILFDIVMKDGSSGGLAPAGTRIVMAFVGGFATAPVQRLLTNLSDAIGTLLQGRNPPAPAAKSPHPEAAPAGQGAEGVKGAES